jgi:large subunit ribosomal protein L25
MEKHNLTVEKREQGGKGGARSLRRAGKTPAVMYHAGESQPITISSKELSQFMNRTAGEQVLVNLNFADGSRMAIVKDFQSDPVRNELLHVDFQEISATEKLKINVHIILSGEPIGVKRDKGILQTVSREIEIECLPDQIPGHIIMDVSGMELNQSLHVRDIKLAEGIKILTDGHEVIASVITLKEEVVAPVEAAVVAATPVEPEVIKKGKKPEEGEKK